MHISLSSKGRPEVAFHYSLSPTTLDSGLLEPSTFKMLRVDTTIRQKWPRDQLTDDISPDDLSLFFLVLFTTCTLIHELPDPAAFWMSSHHCLSAKSRQPQCLSPRVISRWDHLHCPLLLALPAWATEETVEWITLQAQQESWHRASMTDSWEFKPWLVC